MKYLGHLSKKDPLFNYLRYQIMPQTGADGRDGFRVFSSCSSHAVYIYEDRASGSRVVGKFFGVNESDPERARRKMYLEFHNIEKFRRFLGDNHYVARALGCNEALNFLLVIEYCYGEALDSVIIRAIFQNGENDLFDKLGALGNFLVTVHNRSAKPVMVDFNRVCDYFENIVGQLQDISDRQERDYFCAAASGYRHNFLMYQDQEVLVHGDATPSNFFFGGGNYVITFDLERMQRSDRLFDTGRIAGELQHFFLLHTGNKYAAEPFIRHFLMEYCKPFPDQEKAFVSITSRLPFYMGMTLLRIARNNFHPGEYRRILIEEAKKTLQ
ncbi:MAG: phosphotransferase [Lentisphaeria bacterium]|nr:aminoglycoside phosphotransferase family protein [Lentisphaerota bacterium]MBR2625388.1 phosphotransferase [Lentisphaeria bacterium]